MWEDLTSTFSDAALRTIASLLVVYCCTAVPLVFWVLSRTFQQAKGGSSKPSQAAQPPMNPSGQGLPSAEQTAALIRARRSMFPKDFSGEGVDRSVVEALLECANWAPTHGKTEPWRFVVLGRAGQEQLMDLSLKVLERECSPEDYAKKRAKLEGKRAGAFQCVAYMVAICMKRRAATGKDMPEWEEMCAVAASVQNIYLAATAHGVAGYWSSWYAEARESADLKHFLGLEPEDRCMGVFMLGRAGDVGSYRAKRGPIADKVSWRD